VIILKITKISVVIKFYRFAKYGSVGHRLCLSINGKSSVETILPLELYSLLSTYNAELFFSHFDFLLCKLNCISYFWLENYGRVSI